MWRCSGREGCKHGKGCDLHFLGITNSVTILKKGSVPKGRFTWYDVVARDKLTTGLLHELLRVNQTYYSFTTVVYVTNNLDPRFSLLCLLCR